MNIIVTIVLIGATTGACLGYAVSCFAGFDAWIGILVGIVMGAISPFTGE